jgi:hypothetical protein
MIHAVKLRNRSDGYLYKVLVPLRVWIQAREANYIKVNLQARDGVCGLHPQRDRQQSSGARAPPLPERDEGEVS